jgi:protein SCO1/2
MKLLVLSFLAGLSLTPAKAVEPFDPFHLASIDKRPGALVPLDLPVRDQAGQTTTLRRLAAGRPILLSPVQHRCPNLCGLTLDGVAASAAAQPDHQVELVAFGIDPREGPADAAVSDGHLTDAVPAGMKSQTAAVIGDASVVGAVTHALGYRYAWDSRMGQYAHIAATAVLTPDGRLSSWLYGVRPPSDVVKAAVAAASRNGLSALGDQILLLCYHYDATTGRYDSLTKTLLRVTAGIMVALVAGLIALSLWRERRRGRAQ